MIVNHSGSCCYVVMNQTWLINFLSILTALQHLLTYEEDARPTAEQALKHAWIRNSINANHDTFMESYGESSISCLENMEDFASDASFKLRQAVYTYIASQLLRKEEREEIDRVFRGMDDDCDGKLSKDDIKSGYLRFFNKALSDDDTDRLFERINASETGYIDYSEFVIAAMQKSKILTEDKLQAAFRSFDRGDKGYISADDLKLALSGVVALPVNDGDGGMGSNDIIEEMMKQVDVEGDGKISYENFLDMMLGEVEYVDGDGHSYPERSNGDDLMTPAENDGSNKFLDVAMALGIPIVEDE